MRLRFPSHCIAVKDCGEVEICPMPRNPTQGKRVKPESRIKKICRESTVFCAEEVAMQNREIVSFTTG